MGECPAAQDAAGASPHANVKTKIVANGIVACGETCHILEMPGSEETTQVCARAFNSPMT